MKQRELTVEQARALQRPPIHQSTALCPSPSPSREASSLPPVLGSIWVGINVLNIFARAGSAPSQQGNFGRGGGWQAFFS
jgi:hypothetical protein